MPAKNVIKEQSSDSFYHVYSRGNNKHNIFRDSLDYEYLLNLFQRYLSIYQSTNRTGGLYPNYAGRIELLAYCIMQNHFHLLVFQREILDLEKFMRSVMTSYSRYFNQKYSRTGPVFESRYRAVRINSESYLQHVSRYIHLNPNDWKNYRYSSVRYYNDEVPPEWLNVEVVKEMFESTEKYMDFVADYQEMHDQLEDLKHHLADS